MPSASSVGIVALAFAIIGVGARIVIALKPPKSERAKNAWGNVGYACIATGLLMLIGLGWHLYIPVDFQLPVKWSAHETLPTPSAQANLAQPTAVPPEPPTQTSAAEEPSVADWRNRPSSPWAGPMGPVFALELVATFNRLPKPCLLKITGPDNPFVATFRWLLTYGVITSGPAGSGPFSNSVCEIAPDSVEPPDIDEPNPVKPTTEPGIVVHWNENYAPGKDIAKYLDNSTLRVSVSHRMPKGSPPNLIWIDIGPGSPWK
jgi:hypothetical protein